MKEILARQGKSPTVRAWLAHIGVRFVRAFLAFALFANACAAEVQTLSSDVGADLKQLDSLADKNPKRALEQLEELSDGDKVSPLRLAHKDLVRAAIHLAFGQHDESLAICTRLEPAIEAAGSTYLRTRLSRVLSMLYFDMGQIEKANAAAERGLKEAERVHDADLIAQAQIDLAWGRIATGDFTGGSQAIATATDAATTDRRRAELEYVAGYYAYISNDPDTAVLHLQQAKDLFAADENPRDLAAVTAMLGNNQMSLRRFDEAEASFLAAIRLFEQTEDALSVGATLGSLAVLEGQQGRTQQALRTSERAIAIYQAAPGTDVLARMYISRASLLLTAHRATEAWRELENARQRVFDSPNVRNRIQFREVSALIHAFNGNALEASRELRDVDAMYGKQNQTVLATQLAAQQSRLEKSRLARENELLASRAESERKAATAMKVAAGALASLVALLGAVLWRQKTLTARIRRLADMDALTGIYNRRRLLEAGKKLHDRSRQGGEGFALAIVDVDHFKRLNDTHGHVAGDFALRAVVRSMQSALRGGDIIGRYGGEEFAVLFTGVERSALADIADRLRAAVQDQPVEWEGKSIPVTVSIGIAMAGSDETSLDQMIVRADTALYQAKDGGRNRVVVG